MISRVWILLSAVIIAWAVPAVQARFMLYQTQRVPIDRLFTNFQQRLARDANNFELTYDLARLHAMAYSTNLASIGVRTNTGRPEFYFPGDDSGVPQTVAWSLARPAPVQALRHLTNAIRLYARAIGLLKQSTNASAEWLVLPLELGQAWCLDQAGDRKAALAAYRDVLALAWKKEVTGEFNFKEWAADAWKAVKSGSNPFAVKTRRGYIGPGVCYSEEIIGYLLRLLDPVKDAKEIAEVQGRKRTLTTMGRAITPILVPLVDGAGLDQLVDANAAVTFDLDGSGLPRPWGWITTNAAWLVYDPQGRGEISSALQMFGQVTFWIFWRDGYHALASLDDNQDGRLAGSELRGIALWQDGNGNGVSEPGEVRPVAEWGITAVFCSGQQEAVHGSWCAEGVRFGEGRVRPTYDWIAPGR